jgi:hypothetical protein
MRKFVTGSIVRNPPTPAGGRRDPLVEVVCLALALALLTLAGRIVALW